ncbi:WD40 repeat domain-containing protein [Streptomyces sp. NPDC054849]
MSESSESSKGASHDASAMLSNPGVLVAAEPGRVLELLERARDPEARFVAAVYRTSVDVHRALGAACRRQVLALDAARLGDRELAASFAVAELPGEAPAAWTVDWASGPDHRLMRILVGHSGPVTAVATAVVDGRTVAVSGSRDTTVRMWDMATGAPLHDPVTGPTDPVSSITAEVRSVATAVADRQVVAFTLHADDAVLVWDLATGRTAGECVRFVESTVLDGRGVVLTRGADGTLCVWDLLTGHRVRVFPSATGLGMLDGRRVVLTVDSTDVDGSVRVWDLRTGSELGQSLEVVRTAVLDGQFVAVTSQVDQEPCVWELSSGRPVDFARGDDPAFSEAENRPDVSTVNVVKGRVVAVGLDGEEPELIGDLAPARQDGMSIRGHETAVLAGCTVALTAGVDGTLRIWDLTTGHCRADGMRVIHRITPNGLSPAPAADAEEQEPLWCLLSGRENGGSSRGSTVRVAIRGTAGSGAARDDHGVVLTAEKDGTVTVRAANGLPVGRPLTGHTERVWSMATVEAEAAAAEGDTGQDTGRILAVTTALDQTVRVWDVTAGRQQGSPLTGHTGQVWDVSTTMSDGRPVAVTAGADHTLRIWDLAGARETAPRGAGHTGPVLAVATAVLEGRAVAVTAGADRTLRTWDLTTGRQAAAPMTGLEGETAALTTAAVDGRVVVVAAGPGATLRVLDLTDGRDVHEPVLTHHGRVLALATATLDGHPVAVTAGTDRTTAIWNLATGQQVGEPLTGHSSRVTAVATAVLEGRPVAVTGSWDKTVRLWDLASGQQIGGPLTGHTDWVTSVATTVVDGRPAAISKGRDKTVRLWDLVAMRQIGGAQPSRTDFNGAMAVTVRDGRPTVAIGNAQTVQFRDPATGREVDEEYLLPLPVGLLTAAPCGRLVVTYGPEVVVLRPTAPEQSG